jgi:hypothetical protein
MMRRLRGEAGNAVVTAVTLMTVMLGVGAATVATVDVQQVQSGRERQAESRFNLSEAVLNAQAFNLARSWPANATTPFPNCNGALGGGAPADKRCVNPTRLTPGFQSEDYAGATFTTIVRDNTGTSATYYDDAVTPAAASYDANGDDKLWVRARSVVNGETRSIVALVRLERLPVTFPQKAVVAGAIHVDANGNKVVIDTKGDAAQPTGVSVRCTNYNSDACLSDGVRPGGNREHINGTVDAVPYPATPVLEDEAISALEEQAANSGTRYASCPGSFPATGGVVFIEQGNCEYGGSGQAFAPASPGVIIIRSGSLTLRGNYRIYGTVYALNKSTPPSSGDLVRLQGSSTIDGAVFVDGPGAFAVQDMGAKLTFKTPTVIPPPATGTGTIVRSTWRELPGT